MSGVPDFADNLPEQRDPVEVVEENRDLFEKIAASDLDLAEYFERALRRVDEMKEERDDY